MCAAGMMAAIMVTYEITAAVSADLIESYESYMRLAHIPDLLATGCFASARFDRSSPGRYRIRYEATDRRSLERYLEEHASRLREDFARHFPAGVDVQREVWEEVSGFLPAGA